jgi:transposase
LKLFGHRLEFLGAISLRGHLVSRFDLTDEEFALIVPFLPPEYSGKAGRPYKPHRVILNAILWVNHTGAAWRDLPDRYGPWETAYSRFREWCDSGLIERIFDELRPSPERADLSLASIDGTSVRAHKSAAGGPKKRG